MLNEAIALSAQFASIAGVIIFVGYILAKIVRGIVEGLSHSLGPAKHKLKNSVYLKTRKCLNFRLICIYIIIITALIVAFEALGIKRFPNHNDNTE